MDDTQSIADVYRSYIATLQTSIDGYKDQVNTLQQSVDALRDSVSLLHSELAGSGNCLTLLNSPYGVAIVAILSAALLVVSLRKGFSISKGDTSIRVGGPEGGDSV